VETEDRFTPPTSFCAHPEYWHSPDSEATEMEVTIFIGALVRLIQPEFVLETGTYHGHTALEIASALYKNGHGAAISIEKDKAIFQKAQENYEFLGKLEDYSTLTMLNMNAMDYTPDRDIDLAFFDSCQDCRFAEFLRYHGMGRLKPGAIVGFHDTAPHHQVMKYVEELISNDYFMPIQFFTPRGFLLGQVIK